jgi:hypothetical protein
MSKYLGDFTAGKTVSVRFNTSKADGTPITLAGTPAVSVYKSGSTTESTAGVTLTADYDSRTGLHNVAIDTSADGTFYSAGSDFDVVITTGTVDSVSVVGTIVGTFSLANRAALRPTVADRTLDVSAGGEAGIDWANVGSPTTTVGLSGTTISTSQAVASVSGAVGSITGVTFPTNFASLVIDSSGRVQVQYGTSTGQLNLSGGNLAGAVPSVTGAVGSVTGNVTVGSYAAGQDPATLVLDVAAAGHNSASSIGAKINAAGAASDPWSIALPGAYAAGTAGALLGNRSGFKLAADGVDLVVVETGVNLRQAIAVIGAAAAGKGSGLDTATATYYAMGASGTSTARIVATTDASGNRTATTLTLPS